MSSYCTRQTFSAEHLTSGLFSSKFFGAESSCCLCSCRVVIAFNAYESPEKVTKTCALKASSSIWGHDMNKCQDLVIPYDGQTGIRVEESWAALSSVARSPRPAESESPQSLPCPLAEQEGNTTTCNHYISCMAISSPCRPCMAFTCSFTQVPMFRELWQRLAVTYHFKPCFHLNMSLCPQGVFDGMLVTCSQCHLTLPGRCEALLPQSPSFPRTSVM